MVSEKTALFGFHNPDFLQHFSRTAGYIGYSAETVETAEEMLERTMQREYNAYLMDVNLGEVGGMDISIAHQIYNLVKERVERGEAKFMALSHAKIIVDRAKEEGIPTSEKIHFDLETFLEE